MTGRRAVFLDRDGTLTQPRHYPSRPEDLVLQQGVGAALCDLSRAGWALVVVTNQSGLARGFFTPRDLDTMHRHLRAMLAEFGVVLDGIYACPHHHDGRVDGLSFRCGCRKPRTGLLQAAADELGLDLSASWMIGDFASDIEAGRRAGCLTAWVGAESGAHADTEPTLRAATTAEALRHISTDRTTYMSLHQTSSAVLADGREIHFYDDTAGRRREVIDTRALPPVASGSELRWDPTLEEWVVMAAHRKARRPDAATQCPLCPSSDGTPTEIPVCDYDVAVFENRYPALRGPGGPAETGTLLSVPAGGRCEVMAFSSEHETSLGSMSEQRVRTVIEAWADRTRVLNALPEVEQVVCFENRGSEIGATLSHPHGQVYAYPFVPSRFERMQRAAGHARARGTGCVFCRVLETEIAAGHRIVARTEHWTAFVPHAARWPYEVHLYAHRHVPDLAALNEAERADLAGAYRSLLRRFETVAEAPLPYMALWVQAPARGERELSHLHAQIFSDRATPLAPKRLAAGELGAGTFISEVEPEQAAAMLRAAETEAPLSAPAL